MAVFHVNGPNGEVYEVTAPDNATQDQVIAFAQQQASAAPKPAAPKSPPQSSPVQAATGFMANVNRGLGVGDEIAAGANALGSLAGDFLSGRKTLDPKDPGGSLHAMESNQFAASLARQRGLENSFNQAHPHVAALARGAGMAATAAVPTGETANAFAQGSRVVNAVRGATTAGLTGAAYAAADAGTPQERLAAASSAATNPVVLGLGAAGGAVAPSAKVPAKPAARVTVDGLRAQKQAAYQAVDDMGIAYTPDASKTLAQGIKDELTAAHISPTRHPKAYSMMQDVVERLSGDEPVTMTTLDQLRQEVSRDLTGPRSDPPEALMGGKIKRNIDEFVDSAGPDQMANGDAQDAAKAISTARSLNSRFRKVEAVQNARTSAELRAGSTGSGGNVNNATRQNLRRLVDPNSSARIRNLTPDENNALNTAIVGTKPGQNLLRQAGKLSPEGNGLMMAGHHAPPPSRAEARAALIAIAGALSKHIADRQTARQVENLIRLMGNGGSAERDHQRRASTSLHGDQGPAVAAVYREVRARLSRAVGVGGGALVTNASPAQ
jgi:hypothetical protein